MQARASYNSTHCAVCSFPFCWVSDELPADRRTGRIICLLFISTDSRLLWSHSTRLSRRWRLTDRGTTLCFLLWTASQVCQGPRKHWRGSYFKTRLSRALVYNVHAVQKPYYTRCHCYRLATSTFICMSPIKISNCRCGLIWRLVKAVEN